MRSRFPRPEVRTLPISREETLTVKKYLTSGEQRAGFSRNYMPGIDGRLHVNPLRSGVSLITTYLIDWTVKGDDGQVVKIKGVPMEELIATLDAMDPGSFAEIKEAIEKHESEMDKERDDEKKTILTTTPTAPATSPSPSEPAGASNGSESSTSTTTPS